LGEFAGKQRGEALFHLHLAPHRDRRSDHNDPVCIWLLRSELHTRSVAAAVKPVFYKLALSRFFADHAVRDPPPTLGLIGFQDAPIFPRRELAKEQARDQFGGSSQ
jgi:hypothetical protein